MIIKNDIQLLKSFDTNYKKVGKHRKKCRACGRLIQDGERVTMAQIEIEKIYPIKGIMRFVKWVFNHKDCQSLKTEGN